MSIYVASDTFKALQGNHNLLKRGKREPFEVHKMNRFIKTSRPKAALKKLTEKQRLLIRKKIEGYKESENRGIFTTAALTLLLTCGLILGTAELIKWLM